MTSGKRSQPVVVHYLPLAPASCHFCTPGAPRQRTHEQIGSTKKAPAGAGAFLFTQARRGAMERLSDVDSQFRKKTYFLFPLKRSDKSRHPYLTNHFIHSKVAWLVKLLDKIILCLPTAWSNCDFTSW